MTKPLKNDIRQIDPTLVEDVHAVVKSANLKSFITRKAETELRALMSKRQYYVIALHGSSKQGKSNILRSLFSENFSALHLELGFEPSATAIYKGLLSAAHATVKRAHQESNGNWWEIGKFIVWKGTVESKQSYEIVDGNFDDISWVAAALLKASAARTIVLDNFHHVDLETQKKLSRDFTVLGAKGFKIVVAGTWKQADYLRTLNNDLNNAYKSISVDPWDAGELEQVVCTGAHALGYAMPQDASRTLAAISRGSISALQAITARYYLDQIKGDRRYQGVTAPVKANTAAQLVAKEGAEEMAQTLVAISDYGSQDATGRHHVSYIVEAIISSTPDEVRRGFSLDELKLRVDACTVAWSKKKGVEPILMTAQEYPRKVKIDWMNHQIVANNTPFIVFDKQLNKITVNDSMLVFLHSLVRDLLRDKFTRLLEDRPT